MKKIYITSVAALLGILLPWQTVSRSAVAQDFHDFLNSEMNAARITFVPPADDGAPKRTRSGATRIGDETRSRCNGIVPLLPETGLGLTSKEQLSLFVYAPEGSVSQALLSVESIDEMEQYDAFVHLPDHGGVVEVALPETLPLLKTDEQYSWSLVLMCDGELRPDSPVITGEIKRVSPVLEAVPAEMVSLAEKAVIYGESGLWYDLVSTLALMRAENPDDDQLAQDWAAVLQTVGLSEIADQPLLIQ